MATLSTHVLDTSRGRPVANMLVTLESADGSQLDEAHTTGDGRIGAIGDGLAAGTYQLRFVTAPYFALTGTDAFYPEVVVIFTVSGDDHFHVPLLLNPYGYSTYRGS